MGNIFEGGQEVRREGEVFKSKRVKKEKSKKMGNIFERAGGKEGGGGI